MSQGFLKHLSISFFNLISVVKQHWFFVGVMYASIVGISYLSYYVAHEPSFMFLSLIIPAFLFCISLILFFVCAFFVLPYLFQKQFTSNHSFYLPLPSGFFSFLRKNISRWSKEISKVFGLSYLWALLLVIPGVVKFLRYSLVGYITLFSEDKTFPIKKSYQYTKGILGRITCLFLFLIGGFYFLDFQLFPDDASKASVLLSCMVRDAWLVFFGFFVSLNLHLFYLKKEFSTRTSLPQNYLPEASGSDLTL